MVLKCLTPRSQHESFTPPLRTMEKALQAAQTAREAEVPRLLRMNCLISFTPPIIGDIFLLPLPEVIFFCGYLHVNIGDYPVVWGLFHKPFEFHGNPSYPPQSYPPRNSRPY